MSSHTHRLSPVALGMSLGILWGFALFILGLVAYYYTYGKPLVTAMATLYMGYEPSVQGSIIGGLVGFVYAFIVGFLIAWLYNRFVCNPECCPHKAS